MPGSTDPTCEQFDAFKALPRDQPIQKLNLVRLKGESGLSAGPSHKGKIMSGLEAYRAYGHETADLFQRLGGRQIWAGRPQSMVTAPDGERWDLPLIAE